MRRIPTSLGFWFLLFVALFFMVHDVDAISISPPEIDAPNVLRGVAQEKTIRVGRLPTEIGDLTILVSARGDYASYLEFAPSFIIPDGSDAVEFPFQINGDSAAAGTYLVPLTFSLVPESSSTSGTATVGVLAGATAMINFTVSGETVEGFSLLGVNVSDTESDDYPYASFTFANTGNVDWRPERIDVTFTNTLDPSSTVTASLDGADFALVGPGETADAVVEIPQALLEGTYTMSADVITRGANGGSGASQQFSVFAPGTLKQSAKLLDVTAKKSTYEFGEKILLDATLLNDGQVPFTGTLMTEVYRDGEYIDVVSSEEVTVSMNEEADLSQVINVGEGGAYTLTSYVKYANRKTDSFDVDVVVEAGLGPLSFLNSPIGLGALVAIILLAVGFVVWRRRASHRAMSSRAAFVNPSQSSMPTPPGAPAAQLPVAPEDEPRRW